LTCGEIVLHLNLKDRIIHQSLQSGMKMVDGSLQDKAIGSNDAQV